MKEHYAEQYNILEQQTKNLLRHRFGSCSERFVEENHPQDDLFCANAMPDVEDAPEETLPDNVVPLKDRGKRKKDKKKPNLNVPRRTITIALDQDDKYCTCGALRSIVTHKTCEYVNYISATIEIIDEQREVGGGVTNFLKDGRLEIDNNGTEREKKALW